MRITQMDGYADEDNGGAYFSITVYSPSMTVEALSGCVITRLHGATSLTALAVPLDGASAAAEDSKSAEPVSDAAKTDEIVTRNRRRNSTTEAATEGTTGEQPASQASSPEPATSRRSNRRPATAEPAGEKPAVGTPAVDAAPTDALKTASPSEAAITASPEDRIADQELTRAATVAAATITPDAVKALMREVGGLTAGQSLGNMAADKRRAFLDAVEARVQEQQGSSLTA